MKTKALAGCATAALVFAALAAAPAATAAQPESADHGHLLLLDVVSVDNGFGPPTVVSVGKCVEVAGAKPVGTAAHDDPRHGEGFDGGWFQDRSGNVLVPTHPYEAAPGMVVPWHDCAEFLAFVGLD